MKPLVTKKYIFERILAGKPIVIDMMTAENRQRYTITRELFYECGVFRKIEPDDHGRNTELTHTIHSIVPRNKEPFVHVIKPGAFCSDAYGENNAHYLP